MKHILASIGLLIVASIVSAAAQSSAKTVGAARIDGATYECHDGTKGRIQGCRQPSSLEQAAEEACKRRCDPVSGKCGMSSYASGPECTANLSCVDSDHSVIPADEWMAWKSVDDFYRSPETDDFYKRGFVRQGSEEYGWRGSRDYCITLMNIQTNPLSYRPRPALRGTHVVERACAEYKHATTLMPRACSHGCFKGACIGRR